MSPRVCSARAAALAAMIALASLAAQAAPEAADAERWQVEVGAGADRLSGGRADWSQFDLSLRRRFAPRSTGELSLRRVRRSGVDDEELAASFGLALDAQWSATLAATLSPRHRVLARGSGRAEIGRALGAGWVAGAVLGRRLYATDGAGAGGSSELGLSLERYVDDWRVALHAGQNRLDGAGSAGTARLQIDRYFDGERGRVGVLLARGRELEALPATAQAARDVVDQRVATLALTGVVPLSVGWALAWELARVRHDDLRRHSGAAAGAPYQRSGARLGVRRDF